MGDLGGAVLVGVFVFGEGEEGEGKGYLRGTGGVEGAEGVSGGGGGGGGGEEGDCEEEFGLHGGWWLRNDFKG